MRDDSTLENAWDQTPASERVRQLTDHLHPFLQPLLRDLDDRIDKRIVGTFGARSERSWSIVTGITVCS
jgi:hypothetical protein